MAIEGWAEGKGGQSGVKEDRGSTYSVDSDSHFVDEGKENLQGDVLCHPLAL
jgi:hypothetical protein